MISFATPASISRQLAVRGATIRRLVEQDADTTTRVESIIRTPKPKSGPGSLVRIATKDRGFRFDRSDHGSRGVLDGRALESAERPPRPVRQPAHLAHQLERHRRPGSGRSVLDLERQPRGPAAPRRADPHRVNSLGAFLADPSSPPR